MTRNITYFIKHLSLFAITFLLLTATASTASAWTKARLSTVDVVLHLNGNKESEFTTTAGFEVSGGSFHGFDLARQKNAVLVKEKCSAYTNSGVKYNLTFKKLFDGRTRILLANKKSVKNETVYFILVHKTLLTASGALSRINNKVRLNWTPVIWDHGTDAMSVSVIFPENISNLNVNANNDVTEDYEISHTDSNILTFKKYRTVKWYPMQIVLNFDSDFIPLVKNSTDKIETTKNNDALLLTKVPAIKKSNDKPLWHFALFALVSFIGLLLMIIKTHHLKWLYNNANIPMQFKFLKNTNYILRLILTIMAIMLALGAQIAGSVAASVPPLVVAAMLWLIDRSHSTLIARSGGTWRQLTESEIDEFKQIFLSYKRRKNSLLDGTTLFGLLTLALTVTGLFFLIRNVGSASIHSAWVLSVSAIIWIFPIWFSLSKGELPVNTTTETFVLLYKWKKGLSKLIGKTASDAKASFWVREDDKGPIEVRMRMENAPDFLMGFEVGAEIVRSSTVYQVKKVAILKMEPGTQIARKLAACPNASEHHLTPNLTREIIVFRNRRGLKESGFKSLKTALAVLKASELTGQNLEKGY